MTNKFDAIVIGFGKAGKTLADDLGSKGQKVALIEKSPNMYGGTCINKACIPTKALENSAGIIRRENLNNSDEKFAKYEEAINKKEALITKLRAANYNKLNNNENITIFTGEGSFGSEVTVLNTHSTILPREDEDDINEVVNIQVTEKMYQVPYS